MLLDRLKPLRLAVTAIPLPTLALAKVPAVAVPESVALSLPKRPLAITGVPVKAALVLVLYTLLLALKPPIVIGAAEMVALKELVVPAI